MESHFFSVFICGAHVVGERRAGGKVETFGFGTNRKTWKGLSAFFVVTETL